MIFESMLLGARSVAPLTRSYFLSSSIVPENTQQSVRQSRGTYVGDTVVQAMFFQNSRTFGPPPAGVDILFQNDKAVLATAVATQAGERTIQSSQINFSAGATNEIAFYFSMALSGNGYSFDKFSFHEHAGDPAEITIPGINLDAGSSLLALFAALAAGVSYSGTSWSGPAGMEERPGQTSFQGRFYSQDFETAAASGDKAATGPDFASPPLGIYRYGLMFEVSR